MWEPGSRAMDRTMVDWEARWAAGETPWDRGAAAPPLFEFLEWTENGALVGRSVLVPGCGSGHDVRALARAGALVTGLDLAATALDVARRSPPVGREAYQLGDFLSWRGGPYGMIWEHTCFCAIDPEQRPAYAAAAARLLEPGGWLAGVFYLEPWGPDETPEPPPFGTDRDDLDRLLAASFRLLWHRVPTRSYPGREGREWLAVFERR